MIHLNSISIQRFENIILDPFNKDNYSDFCIIMHEVNHYFDNIATLKGQRLLFDLCNACNALYRPSQSSENMWKVIKFYKHLFSYSFNEYYNMIDKKAFDIDHRKWSFSSSIGKRFNSDGIIDSTKPIMFTRFKYNGD